MKNVGNGLCILMVMWLFSACTTNKFFVCAKGKQRSDSLGYIIERGVCNRIYDPFTSEIDSVLDLTKDDPISLPVQVELITNKKSGEAILTYYMRDTIPVYKCEVRNRKINGQCVSYDVINGKNISQKANFRNNKLDGEYILYKVDSVVHYKELYKNGTFIKRLSN